MNGLIAVNVALLLPPAIAGRCRQMNAALLAADPSGFPSDSSHLPHLTLVQQFVSRHRIADSSQAIREALSGQPPLSLQVTGAAQGRSTVHLRVEMTETLQRLHQRLLDCLGPYAEDGGDQSAFFEDDELARENDVNWVRDFRKKASAAKFSPHITVGVGRNETLPPVERFVFEASRVALCQAGRHGTCRRVLKEWSLPSVE